MNLIEGMNQELVRCRELLQAYKEIGQPGVFGSTMLQQIIDKTEASLGNDNIVEMIVCLKELQSCS